MTIDRRKFLAASAATSVVPWAMSGCAPQKPQDRVVDDGPSVGGVEGATSLDPVRKWRFWEFRTVVDSLFGGTSCVSWRALGQLFQGMAGIAVASRVFPVRNQWWRGTSLESSRGVRSM